MENQRLELIIMAGKESKAWLENLTTQLDRAEKLWGRENTTETRQATKNIDTDENDDVSKEEHNRPELNDDEEDFAAKPKRGRPKKAKSFNDDNDDDEIENRSFDNDENDDVSKEENDEIETSSLKKGKKSKLTLGDVNNAARALAMETSRENVLNILKKKFKVKRITDLDESQYGEVIKALEY